MNVERIEEFFYSKASARIGMKIKKSKLKYAEIYRPDHKQISRIINNKRNKNNRFLICEAVISNAYIDEETGKAVKCGLLETPQLGFSSIKQILWGTNSEIESYLYELFILLWEETTSDSSYLIDKELYLCDYIPYAKYSTYWNIIFLSTNKYPAIFYGIREDTIFENIEPARENALKFLFNRCKIDFSKRFSSFVKRQNSFHKLDKIIKEQLVENVFIPVIKRHRPRTSSLGLRVRDLIHADLSLSASLIEKNDVNSPFRFLIRASSNYILELEKIQNRIIQKKKWN